MAHRLSRTIRGRAIRQANVRVGKYRGGTMDMATLRPKPRSQATITAPSPTPVYGRTVPTVHKGKCWDGVNKFWY